MNTAHRPLPIRQRQGIDKRGQPIGEWQTRCECGWVSPWDPKHWRVHVDLSDHLTHHRASTARQSTIGEAQGVNGGPDGRASA